jgi:hypothetical protein
MNYEGSSLHSCMLHSHYLRHCTENKSDPVSAASSVELIRFGFYGLTSWVAGTRGNSKYYSFGICAIPGLALSQVSADWNSAVCHNDHHISAVNSCQTRGSGSGNRLKPVPAKCKPFRGLKSLQFFTTSTEMIDEEICLTFKNVRHNFRNELLICIQHK